MSDEDAFLSRWSRRKTEAREKGEAPPETDAPVSAPPVPAQTRSPEASEPLPPVESLTPESDFRPFMKPEVDEGVKRQALKTLFRDERFNVMDGLDTYIDDYSKPDPIPEAWYSLLNQMKPLAGLQEKPLEVPGEPSGKSPEGASSPREKNTLNQEVKSLSSDSASDTASAPVPAPDVKE